MNISELERKYGSVEYEGKTYILTEQAELTSRLLPAPLINYAEANENEEYDFEMSALATDEDGKEFIIYWIFCDIKGQEKELDSFDYTDVDRVEVL